MRTMFAAAALAAGVWALSGGVAANEKPAKPGEKTEVKEVKKSGTLVCASCTLNEGKKCANVLQVKEKDGDKEKVINYYLQDKGNDEAYHEQVCGGGKLEGVTVTGTVSEKDGQKLITPSKVEYKK